MLPPERKQRILALLKERKEVSVQALSGLLETSAASIRRDLRELAAEGRIVRRHGKAIYRPSLVRALHEPEADLDDASIASLVDEMLHILRDARNLFLTGGAVMVRVVARLRQKTIVTHDLRLAMAAAQNGNDVSLLGRDIDNESLTVRSSSLEQDLKDYWFDTAVIEADGLDARSVFVARKNHGILQALKGRSDSLVVIGKSSLVGVRGDRVAASLADVDVLIIDGAISAETESAITNAGVDVRKTGGDDEAAFGLSAVGNVYVFRQLDNPFGGGEEDEHGSEDY